MRALLSSFVLCTLSAIAQTPAPPAAAPPATDPASLMVTGQVSVNNSALSQQVNTIFKGDRIQTSSSAAARISAPGLAIYMPANSCMTYDGQQMELCSCSSVNVNATKPVSIVFKDRELVVSSVQDAAFTMSVKGKDLQVKTTRGTTEVARSGRILSRLPGGNASTFAGLGCTVVAASVASTAVPAAAVAAPAAITNSVIRSAARPAISSTTP